MKALITFPVRTVNQTEMDLLGLLQELYGHDAAARLVAALKRKMITRLRD